MQAHDTTTTRNYTLHNADCCEMLPMLPRQSVDMALFSPPFADLYCYSDSPADLGNCASYDEFFQHFRYVVDGLLAVLKPGRLCVVHCCDVPAMKERDGYIGLKDFPGDLVDCFKAAGFVFHSRHIIWKDPLIEATRTKSLGLMHKQLLKDSTRCRAGIPDQLLAFRSPGENSIPVTHSGGLTRYCGRNNIAEQPGNTSHNIWRAYASPVWHDIRQTRTLDARKGRDPEDEKHLCPLQLDVIERACVLWSNPGETVLTPFMGVGSEVAGALINGRKAIGIELKPSYYRQAVKNVAAVKFDSAGKGEAMPLLAGIDEGDSTDEV